MKYRIGIDVGGTFTDAVVINDDTFEVVAMEKIPTTHKSVNGVADGIVQVLTHVMEKNRIAPEDVVFIAHGTTQATNALLEGDVVKVGILGLGRGLEGMKTKADTRMGDMPLTATKTLPSCSAYVELSGDDVTPEEIGKAYASLAEQGVKSVVAAEAFSVDRPDNENRVMDYCAAQGMPSTATSEISKLYGLKVRTRTAVINASIMPKMLDTANMTESSIQRTGITTPLMIMRSDGGVMTVDEMRKRPIMTILSGPAAGVAGALMYERLSDGLFFEVGGTSTDISCVKDGRVMLKYAQVGKHMTYLTSLDVRTVGIGGGSMVQIRDGKAADVGPRSVHIAGLDYEVYTDPEEIAEPVVLKTVRPMPDDPDYACVECANGRRFALSLAGAANLAGYVRESDYAYGSAEAARKAWKPLAEAMGLTVEECAKRVLSFAAEKNGEVARALMTDYQVDPANVVFVGGGGGAAAVVPHLAETLGTKWKIAKNAPVISTIGVALAMVRDVLERSVVNPTEADIRAVRKEALERAVRNGAVPETVEVEIEVDRAKNIVRATAIGSTELRSKTMGREKLNVDELRAICAEDLGVPAEEVHSVSDNGQIYAMLSQIVKKAFFGLVKKTTTALRLIDNEGVIRLKRKDASVYEAGKEDWEQKIRKIAEVNATLTDGGTQLPYIFVIYGKRIISLANLASVDNMVALAQIELSNMDADDKLILLCTKEIN